MYDTDDMDDIRERWEAKTEQLTSALAHVYGCPFEPSACDDHDHALATRLVSEADL